MVCSLIAGYAALLLGRRNIYLFMRTAVKATSVGQFVEALDARSAILAAVNLGSVN